MKTKKPDVGVFIPEIFYNTLMSVLENFIATENLIGENDLCKNAKSLSHKIFKYARIFTDKNGGENTAVYFYPLEAATLIELLLSALSLKETEKNYFNELKKRDETK
jgi:hypothetical protein